MADKSLMSVCHFAPGRPGGPCAGPAVRRGHRVAALAARALAAAALLAVAAPAQAQAPQIKPMRMGTAPAKVDPLEELRQRLAGQLSQQTLPDDKASPYELKLVTRSTSTVAPAPSTRAAPRAARPAPAPAPHWGYQGDGGPAAWAKLRPEFSLCGSGQRQSPVDIRGGLAVDLEPVQFAYTDSRFGVIDNGHTVQANIAEGSHIVVGGQRYELQNVHFHRPSEERIDGRQFEMSIHLVHRDAQGRLAVVALLVDRGPAHPVVQTVWNNLPLEPNQEVPARVTLPLPALLPDDRRYYTYMGSLTTPPCTEDVRWVVMRQPVAMSAEQIELFARIYPMNARPIQQLAGRRILQSQ